MNDGRIIVIAFSEKYDEIHPPIDGHVRGEMHTAGYLLTPTAQGTIVTYNIKLDLKGSIPNTIINLVCNNQPMILMTLKQLMDKEKKNGKYPNPPDHKSSYSDFVTFISDALFESTQASAGGGGGSSSSSSSGGASAARGGNTGSLSSSAAASSTANGTNNAAAKARNLNAGVRGSSLLKMSTKSPRINSIAMLILFLPPLLYYVLEG
jgi:hypothetical protein